MLRANVHIQGVCTVPGFQKDLLLEQDNLKHNLVTILDMHLYIILS